MRLIIWLNLPLLEANSLESFKNEVVEKINAAFISNLSVLEKKCLNANGDSPTSSKQSAALSSDKFSPKKNSLILIGSSTGGIDAFTRVLRKLPKNCPPVIIVQHIPPLFSASVAKRLNNSLDLTVLEADNNMLIEEDHVYIAKGGLHLKIAQEKVRLYCKLEEGDAVSGHKPSVDVMFNSATELQGYTITAALLTGMGSDGAQGLMRLKQKGTYTIVQDEGTAVVWGMPKAAYDMGAHCIKLPIDQIAVALLKQVGQCHST